MSSGNGIFVGSSKASDLTFWLDLSREERVGVDTECTGLGHTDVPVGVSIWTQSGIGRYYRWGHEEGGNNCTLADFIRWARVELSHPNVEYWFLNALFDLRMLWNIGVNVKGIIKAADTACSLLNEYENAYTLEYLSNKYTPEVAKDSRELDVYCAAKFGGVPTRRAQAKNYWRASGEQVAAYAIGDARATLAIGILKEPELYLPDKDDYDLKDVWQTEITLIPVLHRMYRAGVRIDPDRCRFVQSELHARHDVYKHEWDKISGGFGFGERTKLIELFNSLNIKFPRHPPTERMKMKGIMIGNPAIDKYFLEELDHPIGKIMRGMRQTSHYADTFIQSYLLDNLRPGDLIYPEFHPTRSAKGGTITGRFSSAGTLNAQNIPARDEEWAPLIRGMFVPISPDHQWLKLDYSQIEYRFFAHYAGGNMRDAYNNDPDTDFHEFVMEVTGMPRKPSKNLNFAKLYGAGVKKVALMLGCSLEEAQEFIDLYDRKIPEAKKLITLAMNRASVRGFIRTWGGRTLRFQRRGQGYDKTFTALNKLLQGSSADLTKQAMIAVDQHIDWEDSVMHLTVHDELDFSVPKGSAGVKKAKELKQVMEAFELSVPIKAAAEMGPDWGHTKEVK
jgi:DNA polymerase I-like protein with 3'-5' exonuclease and polymerase domains